MTDWVLSGGLLLRIVALVLGCILLALMARGLRRGSTQLVYRSITRQEDPVFYWMGIAISAVGGVALVLTAVFPQLERF